MKDSDDRQYQLINSYIKEFEEGKLNLRSLIQTLSELLESLTTTDLKWKDAFQSEWWTLEQVYAVAIDRGEAKLGLESQDLVEEAIGNMKHLWSKQKVERNCSDFLLFVKVEIKAILLLQGSRFMSCSEWLTHQKRSLSLFNIIN